MTTTNHRNRLVYRLWAPVYDFVLGGLFRDGRRRAMDLTELREGERVCFIGVGTGADLEYLPPGVHAVGVDLSEAMLAKARQKLPIEGCEVALQVGDARALPLGTATFDAVVLNLVLSVVPDPGRCMAEALRVARPGGRIVVFDKFLPDGGRPTLVRRLSNAVIKPLGTDINRRLGDIASGLECEIVRDEPSILGGMYRIVLFQVPDSR
jgi:ubiquinone/menaquinone biosynthesis C-methylase UbiE